MIIERARATPRPERFGEAPGGTRDDADIERPGRVDVSARYASFGLKVWLRGSLEPRVIDIEVERPSFGERVAENRNRNLWPGAPRCFYFLCSRPEREIGIGNIACLSTVRRCCASRLRF